MVPVMRLALATSLCILFLVTPAQGSNCVKDLVGGRVCAPPQGSVVRTTQGPACALGACIKNSKGEWQCSNIPGGPAARSLTGEIKCQGGCVPPDRDLCIVL